jgi:hypothetical protein
LAGVGSNRHEAGLGILGVEAHRGEAGINTIGKRRLRQMAEGDACWVLIRNVSPEYPAMGGQITLRPAGCCIRSCSIRLWWSRVRWIRRHAAVAVPAGVVARRLRHRDATLPAGAAILLSMMILNMELSRLQINATENHRCHVPRSSRLYQITNPSPSQKIAFMESRRLLTKRNKWPLRGSSFAWQQALCRGTVWCAMGDSAWLSRGSRRRLAEQSAERCDWGRVPRKALLHCLSHRRPVPERQETAESPAETSSPPQSATGLARCRPDAGDAASNFFQR